MLACACRGRMSRHTHYYNEGGELPSWMVGWLRGSVHRLGHTEGKVLRLEGKKGCTPGAHAKLLG